MEALIESNSHSISHREHVLIRLSYRNQNGDIHSIESMGTSGLAEACKAIKPIPGLSHRDFYWLQIFEPTDSEWEELSKDPTIGGFLAAGADNRKALLHPWPKATQFSTYSSDLIRQFFSLNGWIAFAGDEDTDMVPWGMNVIITPWSLVTAHYQFDEELAKRLVFLSNDPNSYEYNPLDLLVKILAMLRTHQSDVLVAAENRISRLVLGQSETATPEERWSLARRLIDIASTSDANLALIEYISDHLFQSLDYKSPVLWKAVKASNAALQSTADRLLGSLLWSIQMETMQQQARVLGEVARLSDEHLDLASLATENSSSILALSSKIHDLTDVAAAQRAEQQELLSKLCSATDTLSQAEEGRTRDSQAFAWWEIVLTFLVLTAIWMSWIGRTETLKTVDGWPHSGSDWVVFIFLVILLFLASIRYKTRQR